jgi:predicted patatin/cPLA2 family phospholipase
MTYGKASQRAIESSVWSAILEKNQRKLNKITKEIKEKGSDLKIIKKEISDKGQELNNI